MNRAAGPSRRDVAARLLLALVLGAAFGATTSLANDLSSAFGLGADLPDGARDAARVVSLTLGPVYSWVLLPLPLGWLLARSSATRRGAVLAAAAGGALGVAAAVLAYYVSDALLATGLPLDLSGDSSALLLWTAVGVPGGAVLGGLAGAVRRRPS